ncbi:MAG: type II toxin-antitoxin system VapC family toxin [Betaproteobacteria bacterium]|nr:type II toxin-antitoxin system VapC family toxin [Betaproteobacteria bacterium]
MRAVDTNILTRYFRQDDRRQSPAALRVMSERVFCPKTVILEFEWVMRYVYEHTQADIARCIATLTDLANVMIEDEAQITEALRAYQRGMDFADALHLAASQACMELLTFDDRRFARRATRLRLKPPVTIPTST